MNLIDRIILEWSYRTKKGYPDINNEDDILLLESILGINLFEAKLTAADLKKPYPPRHEFHGKYKNRGERFLEMIKNGSEFVLTNGQTATVDAQKSSELIQALEAGDYSVFNGGAKVIFTTDGQQLSISSIEKTAEFGAGAGSGGGAQNTRIQESAMCVVCAIAYKVKQGPISSKDITRENISKAIPFTDTDSSEEEMADYILEQKSWLPTFVGSANLLLETFDNPNLKFHRGSNYTNSIYKAFNIAKKQAGISLNNDKWNPADIWLVDPSITEKEIPKDLEELNGFIMNQLADKTLVGVSLKKTDDKPKLSLVNFDEKDLETYYYEGYVGKLTNNNITIKYNKGHITFRTFNFATNFAGEIQGKTASHGKIGSNPLNDILKDNGFTPLPNPKEVQLYFENNIQEKIEEFENLIIKYIPGSTKEDVKNILENKDLNYKVSKYLSLSLLDKILSSDSAETETEIISDIVRYASSSTKNSSVYVKIS